MPKYSKNCAGCDISRRVTCPRGGLLKLPGGWLVNQYGGREGFLGWLALQPDRHCEALSDLNPSESRSLGTHLVSLDRALRAYWKTAFKADPIEQCYFTFFYESRFDLADPFVDAGNGYHVHIHFIPRTRHLGRLLRENHGGVSIVNAWQVWRLKEAVPARYRPPSGQWPAATALVEALATLIPGAKVAHAPAA